MNPGFLQAVTGELVHRLFVRSLPLVRKQQSDAITTHSIFSALQLPKALRLSMFNLPSKFLKSSTTDHSVKSD
jgi:hypothetical protein